MNESRIVCVVCPRGCRLTVEAEENRILSVTGHSCNRGVRYAEQEILDPPRNITTTVAVTGAKMPVISVKTSAPIPKAKIIEIMEQCNAVCLRAPVYAGDVVIKDVCATGADIVATLSSD